MELSPLFNAHTHAGMFKLRNRGEGLSLHQWLEEKIWPAERALSEDDVYWGAVLSFIEMARSGVGGFHDLYWKFPELIAKAAEDVGLVGCVSADLAFYEGDVEDFLSGASSLVKRGVGVHSIYKASPERIRQAFSLAETYDVPFHIHVSETREALFYSLETYGKRPIEHLHSLGVLSPRTVLAHASWASVREIVLVASSGASIVYCPVSNLKLATGGICPVKEYAEKGVNVCIGTDGPASNNSQNILESLKVGALLQKHKYWDATQGHPSAFLGYASTNGYKSVNISPADSLLELSFDEACLPYDDVETAIVYSAGKEHVYRLVVEGRELIRGGALVPRLERLREEGLEHFGLER